jgi:CheY-like chemotaxis protein
MRGAQLQARLIDDVLDVSRIMSGKLRLNVENLDIRQLLHTAIEAVRSSADAKRISIGTSFGPDLGMLVADPTRLQQIIWNLLTNAVKFTPARGTIEVSARRTSSHVQISVHDSGEGIESHFLPHIFEPFRQAENPSTRVHGGLGLGLSIVRYLTEAHGGTISAESPGRGKGTTFTIALPIGALRTSAESAPQDRNVETLSRERLRGLRILVVDDDREARQMILTVLQHAGADVVAVDSAQHALEQLKERDANVMITDIAMPLMDGYSLVRQVRKQPRHKAMKIAVLSAFPSGGQAAEQSGFDTYLTKPIDPLDLVEKIALLAEPLTA